MKITDEMVEVAILADTNSLREKYPERAKWPDEFDEIEQQELREWMRAALEAVAPMIAEAEREGCAKIAETLETFVMFENTESEKWFPTIHGEKIANAIRARES